jgi:hypothetical protein
MGYVYCINLSDSLLPGNMKTDKKDVRFARYSLKHEICVVFVAILFLEQSHVQAKIGQIKIHINNVKYILNTSR